LRLLFHEDASATVVAVGTLRVRCEPLDDRVALAEPFEHVRGDDRWIAMRHRRELELGDDGPGRRRFAPDFTARRGEGRGGQREPALPESEGSVAGVDVDHGTIRVVPRRDDPLLVGGTSVAEVLVVVAPSTRLVLAGQSERELLLRDLQPGWRIWC